MTDIAPATTMEDFRGLRGLLNEMAVWDAFETRAMGHDSAALLLECYSDSAEGLCAQFTAPGSMMFLARRQGKLAGCAGYDGQGGGLAEVQKVFVRPQFRGLGLGAALIGSVLTDMVRSGHTHARLETANFMTAAIAIYTRSGFVRTSAFRPPLGNLDMMSIFMHCDLQARAVQQGAAQGK